MNVVLIHPYLTEPLGLICLASFLRQAYGDAVNVSILDLYALGRHEAQPRDGMFVLGVNDPETIREELRKRNPDLIGVTSNFTAYYLDSLEVAAMAKEACPDVPVIMGGAHATVEAEGILKAHSYIDGVVRNEGEKTLELLVAAIRNKQPLADVPGLTFRAADGNVVTNPSPPLIPDIDELPIPDRDFVDMDYYKHHNEKCIWYVRKAPVATIMTSRGCPFSCVFCSTNVMWKKKWRTRSMAKIVEEVEYLVAKYGIREIIINDDQFMTRKDRVHEFCDYFIKRKLDLAFSYDSGVSAWLVNEELLAKMKQAGFYSLRFPIESGNVNTLKYIKKPINLPKAKALIDRANRLGFWTSGNFIIGFPYETREEIMDTVNFAYGSALDLATFLIAKPNAGSGLYDSFKKEGLLEKKVVRASDFFRSDYDTTTMTAEELNRIHARASSGWFPHKILFYARPYNFWHYLLPKFQSWDDVRYGVSMAFILLRKKVKPAVQNRVRTAWRALRRPREAASLP
jgi:anaerobic magnesium-protoporphyrin IX monomethyl ester cyclase